MKLKYALPFLLAPFFPSAAQAQYKAEANTTFADVKTPHLDISLQNSYGLDDWLNMQGFAELHVLGQSVYGLRNGLLNRAFGSNGEFRWSKLGFSHYFNQSRQNTTTESNQTIETPFGNITSETTLSDSTRTKDFGVEFGYKGVSVGVEIDKENSRASGGTLITDSFGQREFVPISYDAERETNTYSLGSRQGFFQLIQNRENDEDFFNYLLNAKYFSGSDENSRLALNAFLGGSLEEDFSPTDAAGLLNVNLVRNENQGRLIHLIPDMDFLLKYDYGNNANGFAFGLATHGFSEFYGRNFGRQLEDRLRAVDRIRDSGLERQRRELSDMFRNENIFGFLLMLEQGDFDAKVNLNFKYILAHLSEDARAVGIKLGPFIAAYDFENGRLTGGVSFGSGR